MCGTVQGMKHDSQGAMSQGPWNGFHQFSPVGGGGCNDPNGREGVLSLFNGSFDVVKECFSRGSGASAFSCFSASVQGGGMEKISLFDFPVQKGPTP